MDPGQGFWSKPGRKAAAGHALILVLTLAFGGPWSTLWAFVAESAGLVVAWFLLAATGRLPFSVYAVVAVPILLSEIAFLHEQLFLLGLLWEPRTTGLFPPLVDLAITVYLLPLALAAASTIAWVLRAGRAPAAPATASVVPTQQPRRPYPSPLPRLLWFQVSFVAAWVAFVIAMAFQFLVMARSGGAPDFDATFRVPFLVAGLFVGGGAIALDLLEARVRPVPPGEHCPNCRSTLLLGRKPAFCLRCGAVLPKGTVLRAPGA